MQFLVFLDALISKLEIVILSVSFCREFTSPCFASLSWVTIDNSLCNCCSLPAFSSNSAWCCKIDRSFMVFVISLCSSRNFVWIRPRIVEARSAAHDGELCVPARSSGCFCSFDSMETTNSSGCWLCSSAWSWKSDPLIISAVTSVLRVSTVYQSPCLCFGSHPVHVLVDVATYNGQHCWGCFRRLIRFHNVHVFAFPFACVFTLAFASISVIDLFSVIDGRSHALGCVCDIHLLNLEFAVFFVESFDWLLDLAPRLTRKVCQTVLFHHDLVRKEQCTGVCTKITPSTPSHTVSRENPCCVSDRQSPSRSLWEKVPPSSWRNHSVSFGWHEMWYSCCCSRCRPRLPPSLEQCVIFRLRAADHRATCAKSSGQPWRPWSRSPSQWAWKFAACECLPSACKFDVWSQWLSAKLVAVPQQNHQQLCQCTESAASRCVGSLDCPFLWWLCGVRSLSLQDGERGLVHPMEESLSVFLSTRLTDRRFSRIHCCIDKHRIFSIERRRLAQASPVLEQLCIVHLFGIQDR